MPPRSRYAVDPSLTSQNTPPPQTYEQSQHPPPQGLQPAYGQQYQGQPQPQPTYGGQHDPAYAGGSSISPNAPSGQSGPYQPPAGPRERIWQQELPPQQPGASGQPQQGYPQHQHPSFTPPANHIAPPPHSAGPTMQGPRVRIDPSQMPNPIEAQEMDQNLYDEEDFLSCQTNGVIPLAGTDWRGVDQGNSLPRHLRATLPTIPTNSQLLDTTALPFALLVQPFAPLRYDEAPIPLVSNWTSGESAFDPPRAGADEDEGPPRCEKCRGYVNPWIKWTDGGRKWTCNLCAAQNAVSDKYFCHLAPNGARMDHTSRPELQHGTVDFPVPRPYWAPQPPPSGSAVDSAIETGANFDALTSTASDLLGGLQQSLGQTSRGPSPGPGKEREKEKEREKRLRKPAGLGRVFVVDVSYPSAQRGVVRETCEAIRRGLYGKKMEERNGDGDEQEEEDVGLGQGEWVAIITVAESVGFWNLSSGSSGPKLMVVSDLDDMFIPFTEGFLVDPIKSRSQIEGLLDMLPGMVETTTEGNRVAAGSAIRGALAGLRLQGGQINLFLSSLPAFGAGLLKARDDASTSNTDKEKALFGPADPFWRRTAEELAEAGVGVNLFLFPDSYIDVATLGTLAQVTGGEVFFHPKFQAVRDRENLQDELKRVLTRETVYNATIRIRCSNGLRVADHIGNFYQRSLTDLEFGTLDDAKGFAAVMRHEARLDERQPAFVQVAVLYTSADGERRVRCLNMSFTTTSLIGNVFRFADLDAAVSVFIKDAVSQMPTKALRDIRQALIDRTNRVLLMYRRHCASAVQAGQLILPEGFKLLPLYTLCMLKSKSLKGGNVTSDVRSHYMRVFRSASVTAIMNLLYPRMLSIHDLSDETGFPAPNGWLRLPRFMRASYAYMVAEGAYLMSNGEIALIWLGSAISPQVLDDLYGVENLDELDVRMTRLPKLPTLLSTQLRNILTHLERIVNRQLPIIIVRQNLDGMEIEFANHLVEDSNNDALSYTDYLMTAHKSITNELSGSGGKSDSWKPW